MNPIAPASPEGYPAPFWLLEGLKVFGFSLHAGPMNLWYAGMPLAVLLALWGGVHGRRLAGRLGMVMPIAVALGVNFGIIPLLFTQVVNYQFFYPAGVLIAWPWLGVIPLLLVAYYGIYLYAYGRRRSLVLLSGGASAVMLVIIGFLFANNFSLMTNPERWLAIFRRTAVAASPTGLALNLGDPTLFPRWLMMFGLAITTTATYIVLDTAFFARGADADYRRWAGRFALALYSLGLIWFAAMGSWYVFGTFSHRVQQLILDRPVVIALMALTAVAPGLAWLMIVLWRRWEAPALAALAGIAQFGVIGLNAVSRQWVQNVEMRPHERLDIAAVAVNPQWLGLAHGISGRVGHRRGRPGPLSRRGADFGAGPLTGVAQRVYYCAGH
jgi:hypothetical protein